MNKIPSEDERPFFIILLLLLLLLLLVDFHLTVWALGSLRSFERIKGRRKAAGIEQAWVFVVLILFVIVVLFFCC